MSGALVGLVIEHGPADHHAWAVAVVIAEDTHRPGDTVLMKGDELARRSRLSLSSVRRGVRHLLADGWLLYQAGNGRGSANRYRLLMERFPVESTPDKGGPTDTLSDWKGGPTDTLSDLKGVPQTVKGVPQTHPTVSVKTTTRTERSKGGLTDTLTGVGVVDASPMNNGHTLHQALAGLDVPHTRQLLAEVQTAMDEGHTLDGINGYLRSLNTTGIVAPAAFYLRRLQERPPAPPSADDQAAAAAARAAAAEAEAAERRQQLDARRAEIESWRLCDHDVPGGDTDDGHGNTLGECDACETPLRIKHLTDGCDDPTCAANPDALPAIVRGAAATRAAQRRADQQALPHQPQPIAAKRTRDRTPARTPAMAGTSDRRTR